MNAAGEKKEYKSVPTPISALQQLRVMESYPFHFLLKL